MNNTNTNYEEQVNFLESEFDTTLSNYTRAYVASNMEPDNTSSENILTQITHEIHDLNNRLNKLQIRVQSDIDDVFKETATTASEVKHAESSTIRLGTDIIHATSDKEGARTFYQDVQQMNQIAFERWMEILFGTVGLFTLVYRSVVNHST